jgi:predicted dehydrogenase
MTDKNETACRIGVVGCGAVMPTYIEPLRSSPGVEIVTFTDIDADRARAARDNAGVGTVASLDEVLSREDVDLVLNLTPSVFHGEVSGLALKAGKWIYTEKPLSMDFSDAQHLVEIAATNGLRVGVAPDTYLGTTPQTARQVIDAGLIGEPKIAVAAFTGTGVPARLDDPVFPGTLNDMGVYYLTHLVSLLGPVTSVTGMAENFLADIDDVPDEVKTARSRVNTHFTALLRFASGAIGTLLVGFALGRGTSPHLEIQGTEGTLNLPFPVFFDGDLYHQAIGEEPRRVLTREAPIGVPGWNVRGMGLIEMVYAARAGRPHRSSAEFGLHLCEIMSAIERSGATGETVRLHTTCDRPSAMPLDGFGE